MSPPSSELKGTSSKGNQLEASSKQLHIGFLLDFFDPEDGDDILLENVG
jgi:hypothetical protein